MQEQDKLKILKELLFTEEQEFVDSINKKVEKLTELVNHQEQLSQKVNPIVDDKLKTFIDEIPAKLGPTITETLREEIKNSQDAVVEALFPIIGKMIKKYIAHEIRLLSERISNQTKSAFSFKRWFKKSKAHATGISDGDIAIAALGKPELLQFFVIEKESGLLITNYTPTQNQVIDEDMIAGMLTAIKSFVEDAFNGGDQNLEHIEYELYHIHIQNFASYYIAVVISGTYDTTFKDTLENKLLDFAQQHIAANDLKDSRIFDEKIKNYFAHEIV